MKSTFFAIATLFAAGTSALAFDANLLKANVSFPFKASTASLPAGSYEVNVSNTNGTPQILVRNGESGKAILLIGRYGLQSASVGHPRLIFKCSGSECGLVEVWNSDSAGWATQSPKFTAAEKERMVTVYLDRAAGE